MVVNGEKIKANEALYCTSVLREADGERAVGDLFLEQVLLVEEQDD